MLSCKTDPRSVNGPCKRPRKTSSEEEGHPSKGQVTAACVGLECGHLALKVMILTFIVTRNS